MSQKTADKPPAGWWSAPGARRAGRAGRAGSSQGSGFKAPPPWEVRSHRRGRRLSAKKTVERFLYAHPSFRNWMWKSLASRPQMSLPDLPKFLELLPFLHHQHHTQFARIASFLRHQKNSDLEGYYPSIRVVEYLILKFRNSKTLNQGGRIPGFKV